MQISWVEQYWPGTLTVTPRRPLSTLGSRRSTATRWRMSFLKRSISRTNHHLFFGGGCFFMTPRFFLFLHICALFSSKDVSIQLFMSDGQLLRSLLDALLLKIETKFYSKLWAALQEFATFYIWSSQTKYIVFDKCLVNKKYESFWQSLNLSPAEGFESHIESHMSFHFENNTIWVLKGFQNTPLQL